MSKTPNRRPRPRPKQPPKRAYVSTQRSEAAAATRERILDAAKFLFSRHGISEVTIAAIAERAEVATSTVYALFTSRTGILRALMTSALFGARFRTAQQALAGETEPVALIRLTARVARAIYDGESSELGVLRGASALAPELRKLEAEFETARFEMQEERIALLFARSMARKGLDVAAARRIMWMYTSRDVYRMLVQDGGWTADAYEAWLAQTLLEALVDPAQLS